MRLRLAILVPLLLAPLPASGYGVATHIWLVEELAPQLAAADPSLAFLVTDPDAQACFKHEVCDESPTLNVCVGEGHPIDATVLPGTEPGHVPEPSMETRAVDQGRFL